MLVPFTINVSPLVSQYTLTKEQVDTMLDNIVKGVTARYAQALEITAQNNLHSTRQIYVNAVKVVDTGRLMGRVLLDYSNKLVQKIEEGSPAWDMKCIVDKWAKIYTSKGYKYIKDIQIGDLVLTHTGEFKKVLNTLKEKNDHRYIYKIQIPGRYDDTLHLHVTGNHPILTNKGWVKAEDIFLNKGLYEIVTTAEKCQKCGKLKTSFIDEKNVFCNKSCSSSKHNERRKSEGRYDLTEQGKKNIGKAVIETNKRQHALGLHAAQPGNNLHKRILSDLKEGKGWGFGTWETEKLRETQKKAIIECGRKSRGTDPENVMWEFLQPLGFSRQVVFYRDEIKTYKNGLDRKRLYFFDFAHKELKICVEVNGEQWHTKEQDDLKKIEVENKDWTYLSFWSKEIYKDTESCVNEVKRIMKNHSGEYLFTNVSDYTIEKVDRETISEFTSTYSWKYNFSVEDNESYTANCIVTHNSALLASPKAKVTKDGTRYITVPFRYGVPGTIGESTAFAGTMTEDIYAVAKNLQDKQSISYNELPKNYQQLKSRVKIVEGDKVFEKYVHKSPIYQGLTKYTDDTTQQNTYFTFRRLSEKSDPNSWIHPAMDAKNLMEKAFDNFQMDKIVGLLIDQQLDQLGL